MEDVDADTVVQQLAEQGLHAFFGLQEDEHGRGDALGDELSDGQQLSLLTSDEFQVVVVRLLPLRGDRTRRRSLRLELSPLLLSRLFVAPIIVLSIFC